ncbi:hypothetical protein N431DRAFT_400381 [Stipitochalara longipes BDJ]|nr:hypothetical protein N431DRAFT_400381 [Stipitochalara longipes BDJ]
MEDRKRSDKTFLGTEDIKARARRSTKRSRTGCLTCKFRKVKCDETKPYCNRCKAFGIGCDGYEKPTSAPGPSRLPTYTEGESHYNALIAPSLSGALHFDNAEEQRYFHTFQTETAYEICGIFESVFWQRLVLQACHQERFVLDAVIAISAYSTSLKLSKTGWQDQVCLATAAAQAQFALRKYQSSLQVMRTSLSVTPSPRKALIACLLVCSFEGLFRNTVTALTHARSGQTLVENFLAEHKHPTPSQEGITSPSPGIIEDKLLQAASYFETQITGLFDKRSPEDHAGLKIEGQETIARMPKSFKDLDEACVYWDLVSRRSMHFVCEYSPDSQRGLNAYVDYEVGELTRTEEKFSAASGLDEHLPHREQIDRCRAEKKNYLDDIAKWSAAFSDLYPRLKRTTNKRQVMGAHTLYVKSKSMEMNVGSAMESGICSYDKYFSHFREIITLSREVIRIKKTFTQSDFSVELGIIPSLHATAKWCRERTIRREAIELLQWYASREGHWDSKTMAEVDSVVMELEEEGIETEYIPECARVRVVSISSDEGGEWATVEYVRGSPRTGEYPGRKRIRCPGEMYTISRRSSELSEESNTNESYYVDGYQATYDFNDDGQSGDEVCRSSCSTPIGYLFETQPVNK